MNRTNHYALNQWDRDDRILMEDFNADNSKIDAAIAAAVAGGLKIATGSFAATGLETDRTYTLGFKPKLLLLFTNYVNNSATYYSGLLLTDCFAQTFNTNGKTSQHTPTDSRCLTETGFILDNGTLKLDRADTTLYYWALY